jgi:hypothetical protein
MPGDLARIQNLATGRDAISYVFFYNTAFTFVQALGTGMADFFHMYLGR